MTLQSKPQTLTKPRRTYTKKPSKKLRTLRKELVPFTSSRDPELRPHIIYKVEYTDTYNGEANYSWVRRAEFAAPPNCPNLTLIKRAKHLMGLEGLRGRTESLGYGLRYQPSNSGTVLFILWE